MTLLTSVPKPVRTQILKPAKVCIAALTGIVLFTACGTDAKKDEKLSTTKNVFGNDDRQGLVSNDRPWSQIGKFSNGCSGTLVGRRLVLTAAHCFYKNGELTGSKVAFRPNYNLGRYRDSVTWTKIWAGTKYPGHSGQRKNDWAILLLSQPVGDSYGWLSAMRYEFRGNDVISIAGYSDNFQGGQTMSVHKDCHIQLKEQGLLLNNCDSGRGVSGGPVLGYFSDSKSYYVIGVAVAERRNNGDKSLNLTHYSHNRANIAIPVAPFFDTLYKIFQEYK